MGTKPKIVPTNPLRMMSDALMLADDTNAHESLNAAAAIQGLGRIVLSHHNGDLTELSATDMTNIGMALVSLGVLVEKIAEGLSNDLGAVRSALRETGGEE